MNKLIATIIFIVTSSYFANPIESAEASTRHSKHVSKSDHSKSSSTDQPRTVASWYGAQFHGKRTASGEKFDMYAMTAAHKSLPLSSYVEVTNLKNHRSVIVKINDSGPFRSKRSMDLSYAAAKEIGMNGPTEIQITPIANDSSLELLTRIKDDKRG